MFDNNVMYILWSLVSSIKTILRVALIEVEVEAEIKTSGTVAEYLI